MKKQKMSEEEKAINKEKRSLKTKFKNECIEFGIRNIMLRLEYFKTHPNPSLPKVKFMSREQIIEACKLAIQQFKEEGFCS